MAPTLITEAEVEVGVVGIPNLLTLSSPSTIPNASYVNSLVIQLSPVITGIGTQLDSSCNTVQSSITIAQQVRLPLADLHTPAWAFPNATSARVPLEHAPPSAPLLNVPLAASRFESPTHPQHVPLQQRKSAHTPKPKKFPDHITFITTKHPFSSRSCTASTSFLFLPQRWLETNTIATVWSTNTIANVCSTNTIAADYNIRLNSFTRTFSPNSGMVRARKTPKFAVMKKLVSSKTLRKHKEEVLNPNKKDLDKEKLPRNVPNVSSALFFKYNTALGPPYRVLVDTNFINFSIQNKLDLEKAMMDCLYAKCTPCITSCVMAELEKLGQKYRVALRIAKDPRFDRLPCSHKGTYADDCIVDRVTQHKCYIVATCDRDLKRRIRKIPGVPIMYITQHKYSIERLPEATIGGAPRY
ncbi:hypothetical protein NE237_003004 [Protea cynaroides]|uniref:PIN domain-containing protein n=1 Tax=Protea cynaroides TaxID=273540 RepID=A0A9Q0KGA0_9MAGN|nr:hypothetical protein NE237_003004 [Protea cynaroides]